MSLLRRVRGEVAGAWRSVGYDLGRRPAEPVDGPDVTSTGMGTFPGSLMDHPSSRPETDARPPRRFVAVAAFSALAMLGAGGSYFAATSVFAEEPPSRPAAAPAPQGFVAPQADDAGMGAGPATKQPRTTPPAAAPGAGGAATTAGGAATTAGGAATTVVQPNADGTVTTVVPPKSVTRPARPVADPSDPECHCTPPVPTPTVPSATASPSETGSPAPSETSPEPTGTTDPSVTPSASAEPSAERPRRRWDRDRRWDGTRHH